MSLATETLTPEEKALRRRLAWKRTVKVAAFSVAGWVIAMGLLLFAYLALRLAVDPALVALVQIPLAAGLAGAHKRLEFKGKALGVEPPEVLGPTGVVE